MLASFHQKFGQIIRNLLPVESALVLLLLGGIIWPIPYVGEVTPSLVLVAVYYWAIYRPDLFRPYIVFFLGLLNDALHSLPMGLSALVFLGVYQLAYANRRYFAGQVFYVIWFGFALLAMLATAFCWVALSLYYSNALTLLPVVVQCAITVALFPLPAWALIKLQRAFLSQVN